VTVDRYIRDRRALLWRVLVGYAVAGLAVAALAIVALLLGLGRVTALGDQLRNDFGGVSAVLDRTADVLERAATTATGFGGTVDRSTTALTSAAADLRAIQPQLRDIEARAGAIDVLGTRPLASVAGLFGDIAGQLGDLDTQLDGIATNLGANRSALDANAASLTDLAAETRALATRLGDDALGAAIDDLRWLLAAMLGIGGLGAAVPATGALFAGLWIRRLPGSDDPAGRRRDV
jgi:hypothetical protein